MSQKWNELHYLQPPKKSSNPPLFPTKGWQHLKALSPFRHLLGGPYWHSSRICTIASLKSICNPFEVYPCRAPGFVEFSSKLQCHNFTPEVIHIFRTNSLFWTNWTVFLMRPCPHTHFLQKCQETHPTMYRRKPPDFLT